MVLAPFLNERVEVELGTSVIEIGHGGFLGRHFVLFVDLIFVGIGGFGFTSELIVDFTGVFVEDFSVDDFVAAIGGAKAA